MSLTITIPGAVNVTTGAMAPAVLTVGVGVPGAAGPQGPAGPGVPAGGTAGQYLQKIDGTNYNTDWVTLNLAAYAPLASPTFTGDPQAPTPATSDNDTSIATTAFVKAQGYLTSAPVTSVAGRTGAITLSNTDISGLGTMAVATAADYSTTTVANGLYYPLSGNPSSFLTAAALSPYLTTATAASTYAVIAAGQPTAGTTGQVLTKNSGTNYDSSWATLIPGDRYLTTSTTSNTVSNGNKSFTIGTGLSYTPTQNITISFDASNHMHGEVLTYNSGTGVLTVDVNHHTGSGTYTAWVVNVGGVTPATSVAWGAITGTLSSQTDLQSALDLKLAATTAATTYYPLVGNPSAFLVGADITGKANLASPALTGNVTITSSTGAALFITQTGTGNILTLHDQASDTTFVAIDANGKVSTIPSEATNGAGFNIAHGVAPTTPVNGDIWTTTSGLFARINAGTQQFAPLGSNNIFSNSSSTYGSSTATGTINVASGAAISGSTKTVNVGTSGVSGSTTNITVGPVLGASTTSIGNTTAASTLNLAAGATITGLGKTVNIGTNGVAGSTTNITIGSTTGTSTTTLQGITNGVTQTAGDSSLKLATTAFVTTADNLKANLASPTFTGTPTLPTGTIATTQTAGNNTTAVATTAFVTAAVPAIATVAQVYASTSSTTTTPPLLAPLAFNSGGYFPKMNFATTTSGAGASVGGADHRFEIIGPNVSTAGFAQIRSEHQQLWSAGTTFTILQFSKPVWLSFRMCNFSATYDGDAQTEIKAYIGNEVSGGVDPSSPAVGIYKAGGAGSFINLMVHDGTTLTKVATTTTFSTTVVDVAIYSNNGTVNLYLNGVLAATTTAGPTGTSNTTRVTAAVKATATAAVRQLLEIANIKVFAPQ